MGAHRRNMRGRSRPPVYHKPKRRRGPSCATIAAVLTLAAGALALPPAVSNYLVANINREAATHKAASDERVARMQLEAARLAYETERLRASGAASQHGDRPLPTPRGGSSPRASPDRTGCIP